MTLIFKSKKYVSFSDVFACSLGYISGICSGLSMVNISSRGIVELVFEVKPFGYLEI